MKATAGVTYTYDGDGRRVRKSNGTLYWYGTSGLDALLETDLAGNTPTEFVFFNGKRAARRDSSGSVFYYFKNHLGSANVVTNSAGTIVDESDYYPFGGERVFTDTLADQNYKFTSKERYRGWCTRCVQLIATARFLIAYRLATKRVQWAWVGCYNLKRCGQDPEGVERWACICAM